MEYWYCSPPLSGILFRHPCPRGHRETVGARVSGWLGESVSGTQQGSCTEELNSGGSMHTPHANSIQTKSQHGERCTLEVPPLTKELSATELLGEGESVFFKSVASDRLTTLQRKATRPWISGQHKLDFMGGKKKKRQGWVCRKGGGS